jgi:hypothetical protein
VEGYDFSRLGVEPVEAHDFIHTDRSWKGTTSFVPIEVVEGHDFSRAEKNDKMFGL